MNVNTPTLNLPLDLLHVIRNVGRPEGFDRKLWKEEIAVLRERGTVKVVRQTATRDFLRFVVG